MLVLLLAIGCDARSNLNEFHGQGGAASSSSSAGEGGGGSAPRLCGGGLDVTPVATVQGDAGKHGKTSMIFGSANGQVLSAFYGSAAQDSASALEVTTFEPWGAWPPVGGQTFEIDPEGGESFAVGPANLGFAALAFQSKGVGEGADGLYFVNAISSTTVGSFQTMQLDPAHVSPTAIAIAPGYDAPPYAPNWGYLANAALWSSTDPMTHVSSLKLVVSDFGSTVVFAGYVSQDEPSPACAKGPIAADMVRAGANWLIASGAGAMFDDCDDPSHVEAPTALVIDRAAWGEVDSCSWTLTRENAIGGDSNVSFVRMAPNVESAGAWVLVGRAGTPSRMELLAIDMQGKLEGSTEVVSADGSPITTAALTPLGGGVLVATVSEGAPSDISLHLVSDKRIEDATRTVSTGGPVSELSLITNRDSDAAIATWADGESTGALPMVRIGCAGGRK
ncbi:MAG: hypothetical protein U0414_02620 [Polyangiaceae bacterium]